MTKDGIRWIKFIYLYLVTAITVVMILVSAVGLLNIVIREYVLDVESWEQINGFWECDPASVDTALSKGKETKEECEARVSERGEKQATNDVKRELATYIAMFVVAFPLYLYHWGLIKRKEK